MKKKSFHLEFSKSLRMVFEWIEGDIKLLIFIMCPSFDKVIIPYNVRAVHVDLLHSQVWLLYELRK